MLESTYFINEILIADGEWDVLGVVHSLNVPLALVDDLPATSADFQSAVSEMDVLEKEAVTAFAVALGNIVNDDSRNTQAVYIEVEEGTGNRELIDDSLNSVRNIYHPQFRRLMNYHLQAPLNGEENGVYVLSGRSEERTSWYRSLIVSYIADPIADALDDSYTAEDTVYGNFVTLLRNIMVGYEKTDMPYMRMEEDEHGRWQIIGKNGEIITGMAYDALEYAFARAMRICDFCETAEWTAYKETLDLTQDDGGDDDGNDGDDGGDNGGLPAEEEYTGGDSGGSGNDGGGGDEEYPAEEYAGD